MSNRAFQSILASSVTVTVMVVAGCGTATQRSLGLDAGLLAAEAAPGEVVVRFRDLSGRQALLQRFGLRAVAKINQLDAIVVQVQDVAATVRDLQADASVLYAEPNYVARIVGDSVPPSLDVGVPDADDELLKDLWGMATIKAPQAWAIVRGAGVKVAVVDTGIDYNHTDFAGRVVKGFDFVNNDADAMDDHYHGTHCAGTIGAGFGNGGVVGVAPDVSLIPVKVLAANGSGSYSGVASGITYAADQRAPIISMSLGGPSGSRVIEDAVKYAIGKGSLVVAAMGNDNSERPSYPAAIRGVMAVGATTSTDERASFSNFGKHISVSAPGASILSTVPGGKWQRLSGTSMATPHVAGLCALVKSRSNGVSADQMRKQIERTARDLGTKGFDKYFGAGRINAAAAIGVK